MSKNDRLRELREARFKQEHAKPARATKPERMTEKMVRLANPSIGNPVRGKSPAKVDLPTEKLQKLVDTVLACPVCERRRLKTAELMRKKRAAAKEGK